MAALLGADLYADLGGVMRQAGALALSYFRNGTHVETKGPLDLVTEADRAVETFLTAQIARLYPQDGVFGEEGADNLGSSGRIWVIDPIDGTFNFVRGGDDWGISLGLFEDGEPSFGLLYFPVKKQLFAGGKTLWPLLNDQPLQALRPFNADYGSVGVSFHTKVAIPERLETFRVLMGDLGLVPRLCGSSIASLAELARGETDAHLGNGEASWDIVAALAILQPLGFQSTLDWSHGLNQRFKFAIGGPEVLKLLLPLRPQGALFEI